MTGRCIPYCMAKTLTRSERKQIEAIIAKNKVKDKNRMSAQDSIPFQRMFPDGICCITKGNAVNDNTFGCDVLCQSMNLFSAHRSQAVIAPAAADGFIVLPVPHKVAGHRGMPPRRTSSPFIYSLSLWNS